MVEKRGFRAIDLESDDNGATMEVKGLLSTSSSRASSPISHNSRNSCSPTNDQPYVKPTADSTALTSTGLKVLILLAVQNCSKNILLRYVMKDQPEFLTSAAVIGVEAVKLVLCVGYILFVEEQPFSSIITFLSGDWKNSLLLAVPAAAYSFQMSLEYVALANLDAAMFSVLVQCKLLFTATFAAVVLRKQLKFIQVLSLVLLTTGVMLCNLQQLLGRDVEDQAAPSNAVKGIVATLGIAVSSGFAGVYTEKVIKANRPTPKSGEQTSYSLAYLQVQLALVSLAIIGAYAMVIDFSAIAEHGLWHNFTKGAFFSVFNSAIGGLIVAAVLKFADSVLKGYATAISVIMTGLLSMLLFGTQLSVMYFLGIVNVIVAVLLYNGRRETLERYVC